MVQRIGVPYEYLKVSEKGGGGMTLARKRDEAYPREAISLVMVLNGSSAISSLDSGRLDSLTE